MAVRGIRGAVDVGANSAEEIRDRTQDLLRAMVGANGVGADDVAAAFFTMTPDLDADFPAHAARRMGWDRVPLMCATEIAVPGAMGRVIRVLLLVNTRAPASRIRHQYLGGTSCLRPDLATRPDGTRAPKSSRPNSRSTRTSAGGTR
ncbi:MAG: chorismate mutase [Planctomycetes bacterium]|nr:chorismate mutase [Planctomycetota bacterium]